MIWNATTNWSKKISPFLATWVPCITDSDTNRCNNTFLFPDFLKITGHNSFHLRRVVAPCFHKSRHPVMVHVAIRCYFFLIMLQDVIFLPLKRWNPMQAVSDKSTVARVGYFSLVCPCTVLKVKRCLLLFSLRWCLSQHEQQRTVVSNIWCYSADDFDIWNSEPLAKIWCAFVFIFLLFLDAILVTVLPSLPCAFKA